MKCLSCGEHMKETVAFNDLCELPDVPYRTHTCDHCGTSTWMHIDGRREIWHTGDFGMTCVTPGWLLCGREKEPTAPKCPVCANDMEPYYVRPRVRCLHCGTIKKRSGDGEMVLLDNLWLDLPDGRIWCGWKEPAHSLLHARPRYKTIWLASPVEGWLRCGDRKTL